MLFDLLRLASVGQQSMELLAGLQQQQRQLQIQMQLQMQSQLSLQQQQQQQRESRAAPREIPITQNDDPLDLTVASHERQSPPGNTRLRRHRPAPLKIEPKTKNVYKQPKRSRRKPQATSRLISSSTSSPSAASSSGSSSVDSPTSISQVSSASSSKSCLANTRKQSSASELISSTNGQSIHQSVSASSQTKRKIQKSTKSHLCQQCGRSFSRSDMLTRHSRLHSGLKPYQCGKCLQVFSRSDHLSTHERTHTGEKPYQCQFCAYSACRRDMITRHMKRHVNEGKQTKLNQTKRAGKRRPNVSETEDNNAVEQVSTCHPTEPI